MLMAISLAEKLGPRGLTAFSLHPGTVITQLGAHIDFSVDGPAMGEYLICFCRARMSIPY